MQSLSKYTLRGRISIVMAILITVVPLAACLSGEPEPTPTAGGLAGGILATFEVVNERFNVFVTNEDTIQQILDLQAGVGVATIPNSPVRRGPGEADHNLPYSWHLDPEETRLTEFSDPVCDGPPTYIEERVDAFIGQTYCPGDARLVEVLDLR
jgi:hypothetical protein